MLSHSCFVDHEWHLRSHHAACVWVTQAYHTMADVSSDSKFAGGGGGGGASSGGMNTVTPVLPRNSSSSSSIVHMHRQMTHNLHHLNHTPQAMAALHLKPLLHSCRRQSLACKARASSWLALLASLKSCTGCWRRVTPLSSAWQTKQRPCLQTSTRSSTSLLSVPANQPANFFDTYTSSTYHHPLPQQQRGICQSQDQPGGRDAAKEEA